MMDNLPNTWDINDLGSLCEIKIGGTPSRSNDKYWDENKKTDNLWVSISDLNSTIITDTEEYITDKGIKNSNVKLIKKGNLLMSFKLTIGRVAFAGKDLYTNEAIAAIIPRNNNTINTNYLYYLLPFINPEKYCETAIKGKTLNLEKIRKIKIPYPQSIYEQKKITKILQSVDCTIDKTRNLIEKYNNIKQGLMQDFFKNRNNKKVPLGSLVIFEYGTGLPERDRTGEGYPVYGSNGIVGYHEEFIVNQKGIIVGRKGTAGSVCFSNKPFWAIDTTYFVKLKKSKNFKFFYYFLDFLNLRKLEASTGVPGLNRNDAYDLLVYDIPTAEQDKIALILSNIDNRITLEKDYLCKLNNIKLGLMKDLLTGRVRVNFDK